MRGIEQLPEGCGVYRILNQANGKSYVGCSMTVRARVRQHAADLRAGRHFIPALQRDWSLQSPETFRVELLEVPDPPGLFALRAAETRWMRDLQSWRPRVGYNRYCPAAAPSAGKNRPADTDKLLPLTPAVFHILLALADGERHGYGIMQEIARVTRGRLRIGPGTLYRSIKRMLADGWIEESGERPDPALDDERRRYYRLTEIGLRVTRAEAERLAHVVQVARSRRLLGGTEPMPQAGEN